MAIDLIAVLSRSSDKALILKVLLKVRSDLVGRNSSGIDLFYRLNGIQPLVRLISKPYEKILDVALSILANCCVNKMCCKQVRHMRSKLYPSVLFDIFLLNFIGHRPRRCATTIVHP